MALSIQGANPLVREIINGEKEISSHWYMWYGVSETDKIDLLLEEKDRATSLKHQLHLLSKYALQKDCSRGEL